MGASYSERTCPPTPRWPEYLIFGAAITVALFMLWSSLDARIDELEEHHPVTITTEAPDD